MLAKLHKAHTKAERKYDETPEALIQTLCDLQAVPIKYCRDIGLDRYIEAENWTLDKLVPAEPAPCYPA